MDESCQENVKPDKIIFCDKYIQTYQRSKNPNIPIQNSEICEFYSKYKQFSNTLLTPVQMSSNKIYDSATNLIKIDLLTEFATSKIYQSPLRTIVMVNRATLPNVVFIKQSERITCMQMPCLPLVIKESLSMNLWKNKSTLNVKTINHNTAETDYQSLENIFIDFMKYFCCRLEYVLDNNRLRDLNKSTDLLCIKCLSKDVVQNKAIGKPHVYIQKLTTDSNQIYEDDKTNSFNTEANEFPVSIGQLIIEGINVNKVSLFIKINKNLFLCRKKLRIGYDW